MSDAGTGKRLGYLRVSTHEQCFDRQILGLESLCDCLYVETLSAGAAKRPVFDEVLRILKSGDALVVWNLDRAFRSTVDAVVTAEKLRARNVGLQIVSMNVDTSTPEGELFYTIMAAVAQFERRLISRRTKEGIEAARERGAKIGRPRAVTDRRACLAKLAIEEHGLSVAECARRCRVTRSSMKRALERSPARAA